MKNIRWIIALLLLVGYGSAFGQQTKESVMIEMFGEIREEMVKDACEVLEYKNQEVINSIKPNTISTFSNSLQSEINSNNNAKYLYYIIGDASYGVSFSGDNVDAYEAQIKKFRDQLNKAYTKERLQSVFGEEGSVVRTKQNLIKNYFEHYDDVISDCVEECKCYNRNDEEYKKKYPDGRFKDVTETTSTGKVTSTNNNSVNKSTVKTETKVTNDKDKQDWDGCERTFDNVIQFIQNNPENKYISDADNWLWSQIVGKNNATVRHYREYLSIRGNNPNHKDDANKWIIQYVQDSTLNTCVNWSDYKSALKRWPKDNDFIAKVDERCWLLCKRTDEVRDYQTYLDVFEDYGGGNHYQEAKNRIQELSKTQSKSHSYLWYPLAAIAIVALLLVILLRKRRKNQSQVASVDTELREENAAYERCSTISACDYYLNTYPNGRFVKEVVAKKESLLDKTKKEEDEAFKACTTVTACDFYLIKYPKGKYVNEVKEKKMKLIEGGNKPKPKPDPDNKPIPEPNQKQGEWVVVGASVKGNGHIESNMPCQDNSKFEILGKGWGVAVVSDGAGSAAHSDMGSKVVVERGTLHFKNLVEKEGWMDKNTLPSDAEWLQKSYFVLKTIRNEVEMVAKKNNVDLKSLSATCLAVIFSPMGLLAVHVGDGRMGCKTAAGGWKAIMTPHKGDEANQTLFLISEFWDIPNYVQSGVLVPESMVVREPVDAFAVMSDGCESTAWLCTAQNAETGKYYDQNMPFEGFFNPLEETLASFHKDNVPEDERKQKWYKFIESGTKGFVKEQDDKTMILGVFL